MIEAFPKARRAGMLWFNAGRRGYRPLADAFATKLGQLAGERHIAFQTFEFDIRRPEEVPAALSGIKAASLDVLLFSNDAAFEVDQVVADFALSARIPTIGSNSDWVDRGGLFYFGPDEQEPTERAPRYVAQLLRGAKAAELAMELPSIYHLSINMKTARALGYAIPDALRIRADRIVE
jgi:putative ABC transport system substrate-binding protein